MKYWIEKTLVKGRKDRLFGLRALGKVLWSPQRDKRGADIYKNMRNVEVGDVILHFIDNIEFFGISIVDKKFIETTGVSNTDWTGPAYLIELRDFVVFNPSIKRDDLLNVKNKITLDLIKDESEVFYNNNLDLRQGAYLTPCNHNLLYLINQIYFKLSNENLPYVNIDNEKNKKDITMRFFNISSFSLDLKESGLTYSNILLTRFTASLLTKPFVILTGLSGSGKTKIAQAFAQWISADKSQYIIVPVGADWTNREPLLGYPNALVKEEYVTPENGVLDLMIRAKQNFENSKEATKPYFLILDEMNLSHVERYFADFLSTMESGSEIPLHKIENESKKIPQAIKLPKNLFIIGTVNIDETTYMFSPKVLDRANTIEFRLTENDLEKFIESDIKLDMDILTAQGANMAESFMKMALLETDKNLKPNAEDLKLFFSELKKSGAEFGYRTASEIGRLMYMLKELGEDGDNLLDIAIMQKLLPKLHGSRSKLNTALTTLAKFCVKDANKDFEGKDDEFRKTYFISFDKLPQDLLDKIKYKISFEKISRMHKNAIENGFTSYAEA